MEIPEQTTDHTSRQPLHYTITEHTVSIEKHIDHIKNDKNFTTSSILCFQETRQKTNHNYLHPSFKHIHHHNGYGLSTYHKQQLELIKNKALSSKGIEILDTTFISEKRDQIHIVNVYKSPKTSVSTLTHTSKLSSMK